MAGVPAGCGGGGGGSSATVTPPSPPPPAVNGPAWPGFGRNAQHTALADNSAAGGVAAQNLGRIAWQTTVDLAPPGGVTAIHYGSPLISAHNTVLVPVKTTDGGNFRIEARSGFDGSLIWSAVSDYIVPPNFNWFPSFGPALTAGNRFYMAGSGGKVYSRDAVDTAGSPLQALVFYGQSAYAAAPAAYDAGVFINTPITADAAGNIYFGFTVSGANPAGLGSGFARIAGDGTPSWVAAATAMNLPGILAGTNPNSLSGTVDTAMNAAPAVSNDGKTLYVAVRARSSTLTLGVGYLLALDSATLATKSVAVLNEPNSGGPAWVSDDATSSPMIGPDGDVFFGVLEYAVPAHNDRGWLLHFDATLATPKIPGSFGWDDTASIVPAILVTSYTGSSTYLLLSKYNNYADVPAGDGRNRMAILDPNQSQPDALSGAPVMKEVMTVLGQTPDTADHPGKPGAVKEWCINTAAVDPVTHSIFFNSEDGFLYRWDLATGLLSQKIRLDNGFGQAYTPTAIGPDGSVYAINAGGLFAIRS